MGKLFVLTVAKGSLEDGFPVTLEIGEENTRFPIKIMGNLPRAPELIKAYNNWRSCYRRLEWIYRNLKLNPKRVEFKSTNTHPNHSENRRWTNQ